MWTDSGQWLEKVHPVRSRKPTAPRRNAHTNGLESNDHRQTVTLVTYQLTSEILAALLGWAQFCDSNAIRLRTVRARDSFTLEVRIFAKGNIALLFSARVR